MARANGQDLYTSLVKWACKRSQGKCEKSGTDRITVFIIFSFIIDHVSDYAKYFPNTKLKK